MWGNLWQWGLKFPVFGSLGKVTTFFCPFTCLQNKPGEAKHNFAALENQGLNLHVQDVIV
ncbi:MAG: hypothetical protein IPM47_12500 [Sphingobacteriales bacterium]|nr:MAG: hypothetical protein IPM47_12500 [Sphingobacteriales bacterium]